jgi:hypothetical protein
VRAQTRRLLVHFQLHSYSSLLLRATKKGKKCLCLARSRRDNNNDAMCKFLGSLAESDDVLDHLRHHTRRRGLHRSAHVSVIHAHSTSSGSSGEHQGTKMEETKMDETYERNACVLVGRGYALAQTSSYSTSPWSDPWISHAIPTRRFLSSSLDDA